VLTVCLPEENVEALSLAVTEATAATVAVEDIDRVFGAI